jgi:hypothetical protein
MRPVLTVPMKERFLRAVEGMGLSKMQVVEMKYLYYREAPEAGFLQQSASSSLLCQ